MKTTIVLEEGNISIVLYPENEMEKFAIKELSGGSASLIASGNSILQNSVEGALMIKKIKDSR
jgi:hypothetical protein